MTALETVAEPGREAPSVAFLQWALPRLGLKWTGFRRVRRQVWRRLSRRLAELHLGDPECYRAYLESHTEEWTILDSFCRIPTSRFLRDYEVFDLLGAEVLPALAEAASRRGDSQVRAWSAGCASGEEPYSLVLLWRFQLQPRFPDVSIEVIATDIDEQLLERAREARYRRSSLREVPRAWLEAAFISDGEWFTLRPEFRSQVEFRRADVRAELPHCAFDMILCRNLVCTYFDEPLSHGTLARMLSILRPGGALVIGHKEHLPAGLTGVETWAAPLGIFRRVASAEHGMASALEAA